MSSYYPSFSYKGCNSLKDKSLLVVAFDPDQGEKETFLSVDPIYTDNPYGIRRLDYGAKYNSVAVIKISVIKTNRTDFTVADVRDFLKWTTGTCQNSYLDLLIGDAVKFSFLGRFTNAYQQKMDARTIGMSLEFTSVSPWAFSPEQKFSTAFGQSLHIDNGTVFKTGQDLAVSNAGVLTNGIGAAFNINNDDIVYIDNSIMLPINNESDDLYSPVFLNTKIINTNSDEIIIKNETIYEMTDGVDGLTELQNILDGEVVDLTSEQMILSDAPNRIFGNSFNFIWPKLIPGINKLVVSGSGQGIIEFNYRYPIKIGDCAIDVYTGGGEDCYCPDNTTYGTISWDDIADTPTTLGGYGITDAYTITEVDTKIENIEISGGGGGTIGDLKIDEAELNQMLDDVLGD